MSDYLLRSFTLKDDPALARAIFTQNVETSLTLLAGGANPNVPINNDGDYPIHIAVMRGNVNLVKLLIVFYADLNKQNKAGETALELAVKEGDKARECAIAIKTVNDLNMAKAADQPRQWGPRTTLDHAANDDINLLTLDGGGIRGLVFVQVLLGIEHRRKQLYPGSDKPFLSHFNWIGGTSTGALAGLAFSLIGLEAKSSLEMCRNLYLSMKDKVFNGQIPYKNYDDVIMEVFGTRSMASISEPNVTIMTTIGTTAPPKLHIMSNYGGERDGQLSPDKRLIWEAARASSAAVPYFYPFDVFLDGGFIANNPTCDTIIDILKHKTNPKIKVVLSMGCGYLKPKAITEPDFHPLPSWLDFFKQKMDFLPLPSWLNSLMQKTEDALFLATNISGDKSLVNLMIKQIVQPCAEVNERGKELAKCHGAKFYRINPRTSDISFVESKSLKIIEMMYEAMVGTLEDEDVDKVIDLIVGNQY